MTSRQQNEVISRIASCHGATQVRPLNHLPAFNGYRPIAVCGWDNDANDGEGHRSSPWRIISESGEEVLLG